MLKLIGGAGKSLIINAIRNYMNESEIEIYSYNDDLLPFIGKYYHANSNECAISNFCDFIYDNIYKNKHDNFIFVIIYTNLSDENAIRLLESCVNKIEKLHNVKQVLITTKK